MSKKRFTIRSQNKVFFGNVDIFGYIGKKNRSEKNTFSQTFIFSEIWAKKDFYKVISKKRYYTRNVIRTYENMLILSKKDNFKVIST